MKNTLRALLFTGFVVAAAIFVWVSSGRLPDQVASHFGASGAANGFMPRDLYVVSMLALVLGLPATTVGMSWFILGSPLARIRLPNKDYWLAPERRDATISHLRGWLYAFGALVLALLSYVHWLVIQANELQPPHLDNVGLITGVVLLFVGVLLCLSLSLRRFRP